MKIKIKGNWIYFSEGNRAFPIFFPNPTSRQMQLLKERAIKILRRKK